MLWKSVKCVLSGPAQNVKMLEGQSVVLNRFHQTNYIYTKIRFSQNCPHYKQDCKKTNKLDVYSRAQGVGNENLGENENNFCPLSIITKEPLGKISDLDDAIGFFKQYNCIFRSDS